jgi:flagellar biosynthesis/type III secretory pathway protein FliH
MAGPLKLQEFSAGVEPISLRRGVLVEKQRLAAFEEGYRAGWDDADAALSAERERVSTDLANNLRDIAFTYHEVHAHILSAIEPAIREMVGKLLPEVARASLPAIVGERIAEMMQRSAGLPLELSVSPESRAQVEEMLPADPGFPLRVRTDPSLAEAQVRIVGGSAEQMIDLTGAISEIAGIVDDFFTLSNQRIQANG